MSTLSPDFSIAAMPADEEGRLAALASFGVLDTEAERAYDDIVALASQICGVPMALMGLVDADRVWYKARIGAPVEEVPRSTSFCSHTILQDEWMVVDDLAADPRFAQNPNVLGGPRLRFYAGVPLRTVDGHAVGTLCAMDTEPHRLDDSQRGSLAALARQLMAQLELRRLLAVSRHEAMTDALTGLGNRRRLMADFDAHLPGATSESPVSLLLFDLNGFKVYNDTFGHVAGDALLAHMGGNLAATVEDHGAAYRIGGDEFCVLLQGADDVELGEISTAASAALSDEGPRFSVTASHGVVRMPNEAPTATQALRLADERMYEQKAARSQIACTQTHDALLQIVDERDPALLRHGDNVARTAVAVGRAMGLDTHDLDRLAKAAALHDIGKVGIPDAIIGKPGPLTPEEWAFVRTHTVLGERILAAAPALSEQAVIVRSSHERWDGAGYPDGLSAEEIPLHSRIIFAADALDDMMSERPYRAAMSQTDALAELRRCSGSQFDPTVVAIVENVIRDRIDRAA